MFAAQFFYTFFFFFFTMHRCIDNWTEEWEKETKIWKETAQIRAPGFHPGNSKLDKNALFRDLYGPSVK